MGEDVEIFKAELRAASSSMTLALTEFDLARADLAGEDVGVQNPSGRAALRLAARSQISALRSAALHRSVAASTLSANVQAIADNFTELDDELSGR